MRYVSTRGNAPDLSFADAMLTGLARDGGLYVPEVWPGMSAGEITALRGLPYEEAAFRVMKPFIGDTFSDGEFHGLIRAAYAGFNHVVRCPLAQIGLNEWVLELHHGPTLAFKDVAMQLIGRLFDAELTRRDRRATIVAATSGDTGSAAIEAFRGAAAVDVFALYPDGRVSEVQRRQMTTPVEVNVHALAVEGTFDDCQSLVKAMFNDFDFRDEVALAGVNSINWARVLAQVVYYFTAAVALGAPDRAVSFSVPTGNFGDIFAGYVARRMGLPIEKLVIATNENDILDRTLRTGRYEMAGVEPTTSPSMDIQIASNFERALFDVYDRDGAAVAQLMNDLNTGGAFALSQGGLTRLRENFSSVRVDQAATAATIARVRGETGQMLDPHTAIGVCAGLVERGDPATPMIALGTAHAAKFPSAIEAACGLRPALPPHMADLHQRDERVQVVAADLRAIEDLIREGRRA